PPWPVIPCLRAAPGFGDELLIGSFVPWKRSGVRRESGSCNAASVPCMGNSARMAPGRTVLEVRLFARTGKAGSGRAYQRGRSHSMIITIDGPAGSGKSTVARQLADQLGFHFLNTGAMYRAIALQCVRASLDLDDDEAVAQRAAETSISFPN